MLRSHLQVVLAFVLGTLACGTYAQQVSVISSPAGHRTSANPFNVSQGATVVRASDQNTGSDSRSFLGYNNVGSVDPQRTYFLDGKPAGTVDFVNFRTSTPVTISGFRLYTYDDSYSQGNYNRGMTSFALLASNNGGASYNLLASATLQNSYTNAYGTSGILISAQFSPVTAQDYRVQLTRYNTTGPRLSLLQAVSTPEPSSLVTGLFGMGLAAAACGVARARCARRLASAPPAVP